MPGLHPPTSQWVLINNHHARSQLQFIAIKLYGL